MNEWKASRFKTRCLTFGIEGRKECRLVGFRKLQQCDEWLMNSWFSTQRLSLYVVSKRPSDTRLEDADEEGAEDKSPSQYIVGAR